MKFSVSVPDDLWAQVHTDSSGTSETVQRALRALLESQQAERGPMASAPKAELKEALRDAFEEAVADAAGSIAEVRARGYRLAMLIAGSMTTHDFEALDQHPERVVADIRSALIDRGSYSSEQLISFRLRYRLDAIQECWFIADDELTAEQQSLQATLNDIFGDIDDGLSEGDFAVHQNTGVEWMSGQQLKREEHDLGVGLADDEFVPLISDLFGEGVLAGLRDVRDEARRRLAQDQEVQ